MTFTVWQISAQCKFWHVNLNSSKYCSPGNFKHKASALHNVRKLVGVSAEAAFGGNANSRCRLVCRLVYNEFEYTMPKSLATFPDLVNIQLLSRDVETVTIRLHI